MIPNKKLILFLAIFACYTLHTYTESTDNIIKHDSLNIGQKVNDDNSNVLNISKFRLLLKETPNGKPYGVYDKLITAKDQLLLKRYLTFDNDAWLFNNYDADNENKQRTYDNTAWINDQDPKAFSSSHLCNKLIDVVKDVSKDIGPYYPYRVFGKILRRGDHTKVAKDSEDSEEYTAMVFLNEFWRKNYYGEIYFYDDKKEIVGGATHKSARLVVWRSDIYRLNRPPAVQFLQGQLLFQVQFSKNKTKMMEGHTNYTAYRKARDEAHSKWYIPEYEIPGGIENLDIEKHKTFEYTTKTDGRKIFVYDNLFSKELLDHLRSFVLKYGTYFYDDSIDSTSDNVQWVAGFLLAPYIQSPYWKIIQKAAYNATGNTQMFPYDVSINLVRNADHTRIHTDVGYQGEEEFTCLVYLNPNWSKNYYGETTFFEKNSDDTEIVAQVRPRYGRLVIFDGNIPHSARPPSFNFSGARLTFVTKLHRNEYTGRRKNFQEELRFFRGIFDTNIQLNAFKNEEDGERFAKQKLEDSRQMLQAMLYQSDPELEGEKENEDEEERDDKNQERDDGDKETMGEEEKEENIAESEELEENLKIGKRYIVREETPLLEDEGVDKVTAALVKPLLEMTEETPGAVQMLIDTHQKMREKFEKYTKRFSKKVLEFL